MIYPFLVAVVLFFLYETDFFLAYVKLFRLEKLFGVENYEKHLTKFPEDSYWEFIVFDKQTFLRKLISCPFCLGFWLNMGCYFVHESLGTLVLGLWFSLFLFLVLKFLLRKCYE
jgi:hypothetical protein